MLRTHDCGSLSIADAGAQVTLGGWVQHIRDHGGLVFVDVRDRYGETQVVFDPRPFPEAHDLASRLRREYCVLVSGAVRERSLDTHNPRIPTGEVEVLAARLQIVGRSRTPPFEIGSEAVSSELRYRYRYLDLRSPEAQRRLLGRSQAVYALRTALLDAQFLEVETPLLVRSTPEGARDFLVPSRLQPGKFYALPQSPQLYKQLLMIGGADRYFQLARCLRDEDLRQDRQPEFTQLDLEMSFVEEEDVFSVVEAAVTAATVAVRGHPVATPFQRITYSDAIRRFGTDKPDLRVAAELCEISDLIERSDFKLAKRATSTGGTARAMRAPAELSRTYLDELVAFANADGAKGLAYAKVAGDSGGLEGTIGKLFPEDVARELVGRVGASPGEFVLIVADSAEVSARVLGKVRVKVARDLGLIDQDALQYCWVVDFPMFDLSGAVPQPMHHPFTAPKGLDESENGDLGSVSSRAYDLVLNGQELGSGSIRITDPELQRRVFALLGIDDATAARRFGFFLEALSFGAPPHGGIALGVDRLVAMLMGLDDIREVIAFPKTRSGEGLVDGSPASVDQTQLEELGLQLQVDLDLGDGGVGTI